MPLISLAGVGKLFGADRVLDNISLQIERGDHVGLVGSNGAGKSTLLRIIAGLTQPDSGTVSRTRALRVVYLPQEPEFHESHSLRDALLEAFRPALDAQDRLQAIEREMARAEVAPEIIEEYGRLQSVVEHAGYDYRERVERVLTGLGFMPDTWDTPVDELSGGQRTRANLGKTLLQDGDVLLLDEPSNHLDIPAMEWLETYLRDLTRAFILVAHDRYLLDRVTTRTLDLSFGKLTSYDAPYSRFLELRAARMERQRAEYQAQQQHIARTEDFIRRYGAGQRSKEARGRQKRLDRLERVEKPREHSGVHIGQMGAARSGDVVLEARDLVVGYSNKHLIRLPDEIVVLRGAHLAIVGPNGSGKTTLIRTLLGSTPPLAGEVRWGARTTRGYYSQTLEGLDVRRTLLEEVGSVRPMSEEEARDHLGRFLFTGDDVFKAVSVLSGGERSRAALAKLVLEEPNVLVLDEPTNHLDIASREALTTVLREYPGTLLFVSHDRYLIDTLASELWIVREGELFRVAGSYSDFAAGRAKRLDAPRAGSRLTNGADSSPKVDLEVLEAQAESLTEQLSELGATMSVAQVAELTDRYADVLGALSGAEETWLETEKRRLRASSA